MTRAAVDMPADLAKAGFTIEKGGVRRRIILALDGDEKCGKTHFALTAPGPIAYINYDRGTEGMVDKFLSAGKRVFDVDLSGDMPFLADITRQDVEASKMADVVLGKANTAYVAALASPAIRTVVVDTATEWWVQLRLSYFGKLTQVPPDLYTKVNGVMNAVYMKAHNTAKNVIFIHKQKELWKDGVDEKSGKRKSWNTGQMIRDGFKDSGHAVQVNAVIRWDRDVNNSLLTIRDCRLGQGMALAGQELMPGGTFADLGQMVFPESSREEWE